MGDHFSVMEDKIGIRWNVTKQGLSPRPLTLLAPLPNKRLKSHRVVAPIMDWFVERLEGLVRMAWRPW